MVSGQVISTGELNIPHNITDERFSSDTTCYHSILIMMSTIIDLRPHESKFCCVTAPSSDHQFEELWIITCPLDSFLVPSFYIAYSSIAVVFHCAQYLASF